MLDADRVLRVSCWLVHGRMGGLQQVGIKEMHVNKAEAVTGPSVLQFLI